MNYDFILSEDQNEKHVMVMPVLNANKAITKLEIKYLPDIEDMARQADMVQVDDDESEKLAVTMIGQMKLLSNIMDVERKEIINIPDKFVRKVNNFLKIFKDKLEPITESLEHKLAPYQHSKEIQRREKEKAAQIAAHKLHEQLQKEAAAKEIEAPELPFVPPVIKKRNVVRTASGTTSHLRLEWKLIKVLDFAEVPQEFKMIDEQAVNDVIKAGIRNIPGLLIQEIPRPEIRNQ